MGKPPPPPPRALLLLVSLLLALAAGAAHADYSPKDAVTILTEQNFEKEVLNSADFWLVEFYALWCGHCKNLEPEFKAAAKKLRQHARLGAVDATVHTSLAQKYKIQGYPTIKEFGANKKKPRDYQGGRTRKDIVQYIKNSDEAKKLGVGGATVEALEFGSIHTFLAADAATPTAVFFGSRAKPPVWVRSLAQHFMKETETKKKKTKMVPMVRLAFVAGSEEKIAKHLQIDGKLPALIFIDESNTKFLASSGSAIADEASAKRFITSVLTSDARKRDNWEPLPLFPAPEVAKKKPRVQLDGLSQKEITKCLTKKGKMCVIVTKCGDGDEGDKFRELAKRYRRDPFRFLVADKNDAVLAQLAAFLDVGDVAAVVLKPGKTVKFTAHSGDADEASLRTFLDRIVDGTTQFRVAARQLSELFADKKTETAHEEL